MITISKEDYLKAIATAEAEGEAVISATLANWLDVSRPAVTAAIKRLTRDGYVRTTKDGRIHLTVGGRRIAERTIFRHHLIERMLTEIFKMPWHEVPDEAERLEHAVSPAFEKRLVRKLGKGGACPHGNGSVVQTALERRKRGLFPMNEAQAESRCVVTSVYERDKKLLQFFDQQGIRPGTSFTVEEKHYDGTITLEFGGKSLRLGLPAAKRIWVKRA
jgi:DtxR family Mn-dependent transcriptional regulator